MSNSEQFFATCPRGLERVLGDELSVIGAQDIRPVDGGVMFGGGFALCYAANLHSRIASRVLWRVGTARYRCEQDIYDAARALDWPRWFSVDHTLRINIAAIKSPVKSLDFVTLRVKDALCDRFRDQTGKRPSIDTHAPDVRIHVFLTVDQATFYLDTSGESLFKRGYRTEAGEAPLRENLAAGLLRLSGWQPDMALLDPMCGSGTIVCEAALIAANRAPGMNRNFGFEKLANFDAKAWNTLREQAATSKKTSIKTNIYGSDLYGDALKVARNNLATLGLEDLVQLKQANVLEMPAPASAGVIVTNPPYGVRLDDAEKLAAFYPKLGDALKQKFSGWTAYILSGDMQLPKKIGLAASKRTPLFNGALDCRLFEYKVIAGSMRRKKPEPEPEAEN